MRFPATHPASLRLCRDKFGSPWASADGFRRSLTHSHGRFASSCLGSTFLSCTLSRGFAGDCIDKVRAVGLGGGQR
jgi:hypothetical protein